MIAKLTGLIDKIATDHLILDVNGVGYFVFASSTTLRKIGTKGDKISLMIETHVREDHIHLYGFADATEQEWFQILCRVQGVGTKVGLAILSVASPKDLMLSIAAGDKAIVKQADGVGPKLATRIVTELKDKVSNMSFDAGGAAVAGSSSKATGTADISAAEAGSKAHLDAVSALVNLGYMQGDAYRAVHEVANELGDNKNDLSALIRESLKKLSAG